MSDAGSLLHQEACCILVVKNIFMFITQCISNVLIIIIFIIPCLAIVMVSGTEDVEGVAMYNAYCILTKKVTVLENTIIVL